MSEHPDKEVRAALIRLNDTLCMWERATGRESVLILKEQGGFISRSCSGKPIFQNDITDAQLFKSVE